ncbi:holliday junction resolvase [Mycobacterium phage EasyJones]|nr:holliday junction resolvase [Mycobacterium phage EasyJones]
MVNVRPRPEKDCPTCGEHFVCIRPEQKYCSRKCIPAPGRKHLVCPCGVNTGSYQKKYCSPEHRVLYGKRTREPTRMVTHLCLGCGEEFERPYWYPNKNKYCSNACSHRQVKKVRDKFIADLPEGAVVFHSMWEVRFVAACERFDIPWRSYDGPDIETSQGVYRPDFIIGKPNEERVVDVKGWLRPESEVKCREAGVHLVTKQELLRLESGDSLDAHRALLWNSGMNTHTAPLY